MRIAALSAGLVQRGVYVPLAWPVEIASEKNRVLVNGGSARVGHFQIDLAFLSEARVDSAGVRIQPDHFVAGGEDDTRRIVAVAGPECQTALGGEACV